MLVLVVGAKGGVGTTSMAHHLAKDGKGIGLDLSDGQLAARLDRTTWSVAAMMYSGPGQRQGAVDRIVQRRPCVLLWTPECNLKSEQAWGIVRGVADRKLVIADGGLDPSTDIDELVDAVIVVTTDSGDELASVAQFHVDKLRQRFPDAVVTPYSREVAQKLTEQLVTT